MTRLAWFF